MSGNAANIKRFGKSVADLCRRTAEMEDGLLALRCRDQNVAARLMDLEDLLCARVCSQAVEEAAVDGPCGDEKQFKRFKFTPMKCKLYAWCRCTAAREC